MNTSTVTLSMTGKISYDDEITIGQAARIITFLNSEEDGNSSFDDNSETSENLSASDSKNSETTVTSARDALDLSGAKTNPEKIVALGQYVMQDGGDTFKAEDVKIQFRRARETTPANFTRDLNSAIREGWIAEDDGTGEYYITSKIKDIFAGGFKFPKSASAGGRTRNASKTSKEKPEVFSEIDEFPTRMEGVAGYAKMKSEGERVLWALQFAKNRDINGLSNKDIAWLTDQLGVGVSSGNIAGAIRSPRASGYLNRSTRENTLRITELGEAYLKTAGTES